MGDNIYVVSSDPALTPGVGSQNIQRGEKTSELRLFSKVCGIYLMNIADVVFKTNSCFLHPQYQL